MFFFYSQTNNHQSDSLERGQIGCNLWNSQMNHTWHWESFGTSHCGFMFWSTDRSFEILFDQPPPSKFECGGNVNFRNIPAQWWASQPGPSSCEDRGRRGTRECHFCLLRWKQTHCCALCLSSNRRSWQKGIWGPRLFPAITCRLRSQGWQRQWQRSPSWFPSRRWWAPPSPAFCPAFSPSRWSSWSPC